MKNNPDSLLMVNNMDRPSLLTKIEIPEGFTKGKDGSARLDGIKDCLSTRMVDQFRAMNQQPDASTVEEAINAYVAEYSPFDLTDSESARLNHPDLIDSAAQDTVTGFVRSLKQDVLRDLGLLK
ncbi:MAG: hypothetical protein V4519_04850 [Patescibacteria group bacterium]